jgi:oxygen-independent coproporphyrinogen-3 oxidase
MRSAYVHVPFCRHRCGYCNFTLVAGREDLIPRYLAALQRELTALGEPTEVDTLFFGGGTPTLLSPADFSRLTALVTTQFPLAAGAEWSVESNPQDLSCEMCQHLQRLGVTRISIGVQSFDDAKLAALDRDHSSRDVLSAIENARPHFKDLALDLIFAAPGEPLSTWASDLSQAIAAQPDHISTYGLTYERGTRFWSLREHGTLASLAEELEGSMYDLAIDMLTSAGYEHYEVSNFALPNRRCRHNENYWLGGSFFGVGPGAASYLRGTRRVNHRSPFTYVQRLLAGESAEAESETLSPEDCARELLVFAMRRIQGVDREWFLTVSGYNLDQLAGHVLQRYVQLGLMQDNGQVVRLTRRGLMVSDSLWPDLLVSERSVTPHTTKSSE